MEAKMNEMRYSDLQIVIDGLSAEITRLEGEPQVEGLKSLEVTVKLANLCWHKSVALKRQSELMDAEMYPKP
jgi:hypothetical protein